jgi:hypothetical protein
MGPTTTPSSHRRLAILLGACALAAAVGVASKLYAGPGRALVVGQFEDFFGTLFLILVPRLLLPRIALSRIVFAILAIVVAIELSQLVEGGWIARARTTWIGAHVLGTDFEWADLLAYALGAAAAIAVDCLAGPASRDSTDADLRR